MSIKDCIHCQGRPSQERLSKKRNQWGAGVGGHVVDDSHKQNSSNFDYETSFWSEITHTFTETHAENWKMENIHQTTLILQPMIWSYHLKHFKLVFFINTVNILFCTITLHHIFLLLCAKRVDYSKQLKINTSFGNSIWAYLLFNLNGNSEKQDGLGLPYLLRDQGFGSRLTWSPFMLGFIDLRLTSPDLYSFLLL